MKTKLFMQAAVVNYLGLEKAMEMQDIYERLERGEMPTPEEIAEIIQMSDEAKAHAKKLEDLRAWRAKLTVLIIVSVFMTIIGILVARRFIAS